jgi:hypothetical protein
MQQESVEETEGIIALRRLQNNDFKLWSREEIESSNLSNKSKEILFYVAKQNSFRKIPSQKEIRQKFKIYDYYSLLLRKREMLFGVTIPEIVRFYGLDHNIRCGRFDLPSHLEWLEEYLKEISSGNRGSKLPWHEKIKSARSPTYNRHLVAILKDKNELPCYLPLGFHIK